MIMSCNSEFSSTADAIEYDEAEIEELTGELIFMDEAEDMFIHEDWLLGYDY